MIYIVATILSVIVLINGYIEYSEKKRKSRSGVKKFGGRPMSTELYNSPQFKAMIQRHLKAMEEIHERTRHRQDKQ